MTAMNLHGDFGHTDLSRNLLAQQSAGDQGYYLALARRQGREPRPDVGDLLLVVTPRLVPLDCRGDGIEKVLIAKRLQEEIDGAGFHGAHRHGDVSMSRDENYRYSNVRVHQLGLEVEPAQSVQPYVSHNAAS